MDIEKMIEAITREVLKQIDQNQPHEKASCKRILILDNLYKTTLMKILENQLSPELLLYDLSVYQGNEIIEPYDCILLPCLTIEDLVNIATGVRSNTISRAVSDGLLYSKEIVILEEGLVYNRFKDTCNQAYFQMLEDYRRRIESFGVNIIKEKELINTFMKPHSPFKKLKSQESQRSLINKRVITESDLEKLFLSGSLEVLISNRAIITPLARDYIKEKNIKLIQVE